MSREISARFVVLACGILGFVGCGSGTGSDDDTVPGPSTPGGPMVRVIFNGQVALVPDDESATPPLLWALVGDSTSPAKLPLHEVNENRRHVLVPHVPRLWFSGVIRKGKADGEGTVCGQVDRLHFIDLRDVDISIDAAWTDRDLTLTRGTGVLPRPCDPGSACGSQLPIAEQIKDFQWTAPVEEIARAAGVQDPKIRSELFAEPHCTDCDLIAARFKFSRGRVFTHKLFKRTTATDGPDIATFDFPPATIAERALAETVALEGGFTGLVTITGKRFDRDEPAFEPIELELEAGQSVIQMWVDNSPQDLKTGVCQGSTGDFLFAYNLLETPPTGDVPLPREVGAGPSDGGGCSPPSYTKP